MRCSPLRSVVVHAWSVAKDDADAAPPQFSLFAGNRSLLRVSAWDYGVHRLSQI